MRHIAESQDIPTAEAMRRASAFHQAGRHEEAIRLYQRVLAGDPDNAEAHYNLGVLFQASGRLDEAGDAFRRFLEIRPGHAETHTYLGNVLKAQGRFDEAVSSHRTALAMRPDFAEAWSNLGSTYKKNGRIAEALTCFRRAVDLRPDHPEMRYNLGNAYLAGGEFAEAEARFRSVLEVDSRHLRARINLGEALREQGRFEEAIACFRHAVSLSPECADGHWNLGLALLMAGDFPEGWREYEWRRRIPGFAIHAFDAPLWDGGHLGGRTLLLHAEQGMGDAIQFIRYAPLARAAAGRGAGRVTLDCPPRLVELFADVEGVDEVIPHGEDIPPFDLQAPLMSLPGLLDPGLEKAAACVPYLRPDPDLSAAWRQRLGHVRGLKIGIGWQGNPQYLADRTRSLPVAHFLPLARLAGVELFSLQKEFGAEQLASLPKDAGIVDLGSELDVATGAFVETASVIANLDLVIASDTALPHLAGALGAKVWLLVACVPDWRWLREGENTPWYPTMRLFRQERPGDWEGVFDRVIAALRSGDA